MDEHPDTIDDALLYTANYAVSTLVEIPGPQHAGAGGVTYADVHCDIHKWRGKFANQPVTYSRASGSISLTAPDLIWLAQRTPGN